MTVKLLCELQDDKYTLGLNNQDIEFIRDYFGIKNPDITGVLTEDLNGDYGEVWVTESSRPFELSASYELVDKEYLEFVKECYAEDNESDNEDSEDEDSE